MSLMLQYGPKAGGLRATLKGAQAEADRWGKSNVLITQLQKAAELAPELGITFETVWTSSNGTGAEIRLTGSPARPTGGLK